MDTGGYGLHMSEVQPISDPNVDAGLALDKPIIVVTAVHLNRRAREALAARLGAGHLVRDIREAGSTADIVLVPAMSSQGVGGLRDMFPGAKILACEFVDDEYGVDIMGPMRRTVAAGFDGYFMAADLAGVAQATRDAAQGRPVGILGAGPDGGRAQLDGPMPSPTRGILYIVDSGHVLTQASAIDAVPLDERLWASQLGVDDGVDDRQRYVTLMWWVAQQFLLRGVDVVCDVVEWRELASKAGIDVVDDPA